MNINAALFKRSLLTVAISLFVVSTAQAVTTTAAGGGTITFSGAVTDTTCDITTNGGGDFTVNLAPITKAQAGASVGVIADNAQDFTISVSGCDGYNNTSATAQALDITFSGANLSPDEAYLENATGTASGVGIALTKDGTSANKVDLNKALATGLNTTEGTSGSGIFDTGAAGPITFYANYYNYGGATISTGSVITTATYTLSYE